MKIARPPLLRLFVLLLTICTVQVFGQPTAPAGVEGPLTDVPVHDPVIIRQDGTYYLFTTGRGVSVWSSPDMVNWTRQAPVFSEPPAWAVEAVPTFRGHIWAPDISHHDGKYYLYYSISAFGRNTSCIGLATNVTLDPADPDFKWVDHGKVIQSFPGVTNWNAIDPNIITDEDGTPYMSFGSFWEGLKLVKLTPDRTAIAEDWENLPTLASRLPAGATAVAPGQAAPAGAGRNAIEAPFIFKRDDHYYLFFSIDYCCRGAESTYRMAVGRSPSLSGPYVDREGRALAEGGGTILLAGNERWHGVGHNAVARFDNTDYLVYHAYDAMDDRGRAKLRINRIDWDADGWPAVGESVTP